MIILSVVFRNALLTQDLTPPDDFVRRGFFVDLTSRRFGRVPLRRSQREIG